MVKERSCDRCGIIITRGEDYYKVCLLEHKGKLQKLNHAGDLCKARKIVSLRYQCGHCGVFVGKTEYKCHKCEADLL
jgi:hypothetical protein